MRAGRIEQFGTRPFLADMPEPNIAEGESLVQVQAASVGHLDVTIANGRFGVSPALPYTPGVEGAGVVVAGAAHAPGTRVAIRGGGVGMQRDGTWAEFVAVPDRALRTVPDDMPLDVAACFYVPLATAYLALHDVGGFAAPESVLVTGASGTVGRVAVDLALDAGAERVVAVVGRASHAAIGRNDPRVTGVCADGAELVDALTDAPALAIDTVGGSTLEAILAAMPAGGRVACVGYTRGTDVTLHLPTFLLNDVRLLPVNGIALEARGRTLVPHLVRLLESGRVDLARERFALDDLESAWDRLTSGEAVGRVVVQP